jgi:orotate phosphoribosyltransferase
MILDEEIHDIVKGFFEAKVFQMSISPLFQLAGGKQVPVSINYRKIFSHPLLRKKVITKWAYMLKDAFPAFFQRGHLVFAGTAAAGIAPAYALAEFFGSGFVYVNEKENGFCCSIEGSLPSSAQVIVVDDMVTTASGVIHAVEMIKRESPQAIMVSSLSSHHLKKAHEALASQNLVFKSLFYTTDVLDIAYAKSFITGREMKMIMEWLNQLDDEG